MSDETTVADGQTAETAVTGAPATPTEATTEQTVAATTTEAAPGTTETGEQPAAGTGQEQAPAESQRDSKAERRIGKLTARAKQAEESVTQLTAEKTALEQQLAGLAAPSADAQDYDSDAAQTAAVVGHATTQANVQGRIDSTNRELARVQQAQQAEIATEVQEKVAAFSAKTPDYTTSVAKIANLPNLANSVVQVDNTAEVFYALSKDLGLAVALESMTEPQRLVELGRLSAEVTVKPVTVSSAPPPVQSAQGGTAATESGPRDDMSMDEFSTWHDKQYGAAT